MATFVGYRGGMESFVSKFIKGDGNSLHLKFVYSFLLSILLWFQQSLMVPILSTFLDIGSSIGAIPTITFCGLPMKKCIEIRKAQFVELPNSLIIPSLTLKLAEQLVVESNF